jgi:hypothetical protein
MRFQPFSCLRLSTGYCSRCVLVRACTGAFVLSLIAAGASEVRSEQSTIQMLDGSKSVGEVVAWNDSELNVVSSSASKDLAISKLLDVRWPRQAVTDSDSIFVELVDGSRLAYSTFSLEKQHATLGVSFSERPLIVGRQALRRIDLRPSAPLIVAALEEIERKELAGDAIVVAQRGSESMDYLTGVIGDVTTDQAIFEWEGDRVPVKRSKIAALVFYQPQQPTGGEATCQLTLTDASLVVASKVTLTDQLLTVATPAGLELQVPMEMLVRADFSSGKIQYLSDMTPIEVRWTPALGVPPIESVQQRSLPRPDSSYAGTPLTLLWKDGKNRGRREVRTYEKGLALRSSTDVSYRLPPGMRRFSAIAGINPDDASAGSVMLTISADDAVLWEGPVKGAKPHEIDVELGEARRLHIRVDYGENLDFGDQLHLVEARVTK